MENYGMDIRNAVLLKALYIESITSIFLSQLIGVEDRINSYSFGQSSNALSFNAKINLLIDIGALNNSEKNKFRIFMELRNQLMHNLSASTYENCFANMKDRKNFILSLGDTSDNLSLELRLKAGVEKLCSQVEELASGVVHMVTEKIDKEVRHKLNFHLVESLEQEMKKTKEILINGLTALVKDDSIPIKEVVSLLQLFHSLVIDETKKNVTMKLEEEKNRNK